MSTREVRRLLLRARDIRVSLGWCGVAAKGAHKVGVLMAYPAARLAALGKTFDSPYGELAYFVHPYNATWRGERAVEIPIARAFLWRQHGRGLEVGNVLSYYTEVNHRVIDKYEQAPRVDNIDVLDVNPSAAYDFIVSISTLEHVGWDERPRSEGKALRAIRHLQSALAPGGSLLVSVPLDHHPALTDAIVQGVVGATAESFYVRTDRRRWVRYGTAEEADPASRRVIWVAEIRPSGMTSVRGVPKGLPDNAASTSRSVTA